MVNKVQILLTGLSCLFFTACSSISYFGIETFTPAEVTFPDSVRSVVIVDNALKQPSDFGVEAIFMGEKRKDYSINTDSITYFASQALARMLYDSKYFDNVMLYRDPVRIQGPFYSDVKLLPEQVLVINQRTNADAVISIDRLLFNAKKDIRSLDNNYQIGSIVIEVSGTLRVYLPEEKNPLSTIYVADTIACWIGDGNIIGTADVKVFSDEEALRFAVMEALYRINNRFIPYWKPEERYFYKQIGSRWIEASAYAKNEKWDEAANRWLQIFQSTPKNSTKAKAAFNMALYNELKENFPKALDWAEKSQALFEKHYEGKEQHGNIIRAKSYVDVLSKRILADQKLNVQVGK